MIERIIVHKTLIDSFKRKAVKALPNEIIVAVLGKMEKNDLHVYAFDKLEVVKSKHTFIQYEQPEEELEAGSDLKYFGTLHSHPNGTLHTSEDDRESFFNAHNSDHFMIEDHEGEQLMDEIMGIMGIVRKRKVIHYGIAFYNSEIKPIEVIFSENRKEIS
jgi:proteasome lid subunit RPN8/RPN11